jgi:hypothetical protein
MLSHSSGCSVLLSVLLSESSVCWFVALSGFVRTFSTFCGSPQDAFRRDSVFISASFETELSLLSTSLIVAWSKIIGLLLFVLAPLEILLFPCSFEFPEFLTGRAISAIKHTMQMTAVRFTSFRNTPLKHLTVAFSNEHPPHASGLK